MVGVQVGRLLWRGLVEHGAAVVEGVLGRAQLQLLAGGELADAEVGGALRSGLQHFFKFWNFFRIWKKLRRQRQ